MKNDTITPMTTLSPQPYKGTRDWYPEDKAVQNYIFATWKKTVEQFGFKEYGAPLLEPLEVYAAKSGDELAGEQTYAFTDRGDRTVAIRPEMTPTVSRMVAARRQELPYPARLYSIANFMRYERPQRGREREFWQLNVDTFGADDVAAEAETLLLADEIMKAFGASTNMYEIRVNSRELIEEMTRQYLGLDEVQAGQLVRLIDRKNKLPAEVFVASVREILETDEKVARLEAVFSAESIETLPEGLAGGAAAGRVRELFVMLSSLGVSSVRFDVTLMRGLDYYTGTVFEVFDVDPENNRSLFGGGRYDGLVGMFGVEPVSAVGFAPGLTTTELFLRSHNLLPDLRATVDMYVASVGDTVLQTLQLAATLRSRGISVETDTTGRKFDKLIKMAEKKGATEIVFVGANEIESGEYKAKNLTTGEERQVA
ncbi:histidine--tRNA ligase [Candidatus Saccharibacteria bacterium 32-50-13]|nr:MAG: histidine--tRNA ligase [Candidatus Saccharibacteria bacterium 32-50-13]